MSRIAPYIAELCRLYVLVTLIVAAAGKVRTLADFRSTVVALVDLPERWAGLAALAVVCVEALIAAALLVGGGWARAGMAAAIGLFAGFSLVLLVALVQRRVVQCNCFGARAHAISHRDLIRNAGLIAACGLYLFFPPAGGLAVTAYPFLLGLALLLFLVSSGWFAAEEPPLTLPIGEAIPAFEGGSPADGRRIGSADLAGKAAVLAFLSEGCPACRDKAAELVGILPGVRNAGVVLWVIGADTVQGVDALVAGTPLQDHVLTLDAPTRQRLNPRNIVPFYLFIEDGVVRASNAIGDEDWLTFIEQMRDFVAQDEPRQRARA